MKNTVLNLYLKEDKNEEYFEKFFDIEFQLPEIDYSEYIKIEYEKYYYSYFYDINTQDSSSDKKELLFEKNFLDILNFYNKSDNSWERQISLRTFIKTFKKFKILISSLTEKEKENYSLILCLIIYFYCKEFKFKLKNDLVFQSEKEYLSIFRNVFNSNTNLENLHKIIINKKIYISSFSSNREQVMELGLKFNNLYYNIVNTEKLEISSLIINPEYIDSSGSNIIWEWCQKKYEFIKNMD